MKSICPLNFIVLPMKNIWNKLIETVHSLLLLTFFPVKVIWTKEKAVFLAFCMANLVIGQIGIIGSFLIAIQSHTSFGRVLYQNLQSGNLSVFAVSLLVTTCSILISEYLEPDKENQKLELKSHKAVWSFVAIFLIILQAMLTGQLIADSLTLNVGLSEPKPEMLFDVIFCSRNIPQLVLWLLSMWVAIEVFCVSRMHLHPAELHHWRDTMAAIAANNARNLSQTSFGEKV
jgi:hypothetical protein